MASDLTHGDATPVSAPATEQPGPVGPLGREHRMRFLVIYGILALAIAGAIAGLVAFAGNTISPPAPWSSWKPSGGGQGAAREIAAHVSKSYRLPDGNQLVDVISKAPAVSPASSQQIPIHYIAIRGTKGAADEIFDVSGTNSVMYSLCGLGASCSIATGAPSVERGTLVRRQILELALYTFKYVSGVQHVIAFMPPQPGRQPQYVIYLNEKDVTEQLKRPLTTTLNAKVPLPKAIPPREVQTIDAVTEPRVYTFSLSQAQQGDAILVLAPLPA